MMLRGGRADDYITPQEARDLVSKVFLICTSQQGPHSHSLPLLPLHCMNRACSNSTLPVYIAFSTQGLNYDLGLHTDPEVMALLVGTDPSTAFSMCPKKRKMQTMALVEKVVTGVVPSGGKGSRVIPRNAGGGAGANARGGPAHLQPIQVPPPLVLDAAMFYVPILQPFV